MVGIEREIHNQTVCIQQGVNLTGSNYIQNELVTVIYGGTTGLRQRILIRFAINTHTSPNSTYRIVSGGIFPCFGGDVISVKNGKLWIYDVNTNIDVAYGQYFEIVCGGDGVPSQGQPVYVNGTKLDGVFNVCNNAPQIIRNCILFELLSGYGNGNSFLNNINNLNTNAPQLVKKIYNGGKGSDVTKMRFYYGRNYLNQSITGPSIHVRFEQGKYNQETREFNRIKTEQIGHRTIYQPSVPNGIPTFVQRIGTQIII